MGVRHLGSGVLSALCTGDIGYFITFCSRGSMVEYRMVSACESRVRPVVVARVITVTMGVTEFESIVLVEVCGIDDHHSNRHVVDREFG